MQRKFLLLVIFLFVAALTAEMAMTNSGGPPTAHTGAPGESNCTSCHSDFAVNSGTGTRTLVLNSTPGLTSYTPGQTYTVTYTLNQSGISKFGFQATVKRANGTSAGTLINGSPNQTSISGNYIYQNGGGTAATSTGQRVWTFSWTAPAAGAGTVTFYVAGNATNADNGSTGDRIYTNSFAFTEAAAPAAVNAATFTPAAICRGGSVTVNFTITGTFNSGNVFTAQLSDASGNFGNPVTIGTLTSTTAGAISASIPSGTAGGTGYKVRVVASNPAATGTASTASLNVTVPATAPTVNYDGRTLTATGSGNIVWFRNGSQITGATGASFVPTQDGSYTAGIENTGCSPSISTAVVVTAGITLFTAPTAVCQGEVISTNPTLFGTFSANNVFSVELSDNTGSFNSPQVIGSGNGATAGSLDATIPHGITLGSGYRIRLKATSPLAMSAESAIITANATPATPTIQQNGLVLTSSAATGNQWFRNGQLLVGETGVSLNVTQNGLYKVMATLLNCSSDTSFGVEITTVSVFTPLLDAVKIYPNPAKSQLNLLTDQALQLEIRDLQGRLHRQYSVVAGHHILALDGLAAGVYLASMQLGDAVRIEKIVVE